MTDWSRRQLVVGAAAAGLGWPGLRWLPSAQDRAWIPSDRFLADLPRIMELASVPAVSVAVVEDGTVTWRRAFGVTNVDTRAPATEESVFPAASLGKPVFSYLVMTLVDEGRLDLDRPLVETFRPDDLADDPRLSRITPRHVMSHTTGLPNWRDRSAKTLRGAFEPGARFQYSGEGFFWLQRVVETLTGQGIDLVARERLFQPAGMTRSTYAWSADFQRWTVYGHDDRGKLVRQWNRASADPLLELAARWGKPMSEWTAADVFRGMAETHSPLPPHPNFAIPNVAGSLLATAADYARFVTLMFPGQRAAWQIEEPRRVAMLTPAVDLNRALSWGLGWGLESRPTGRLCWHWGDNGIFKAFTVSDPDRRRAIVVFTNSESGPKVYQRLIADATGMDLAAWLWI